MTEDDAQALMRMLREALQHLAAQYDEQQTYLDSIGTSPVADELALELDDVAGAVYALDRLSPGARVALQALEAQLDTMGGPENSARWTTRALERDEAWEKVRALARDALERLKRTTPSREGVALAI